MSDRLKSPYPYFGGKMKVADLVWSRFGDVENYVEPFFGSGAMLLGRPGEPTTETVNDADGFISTVWRALKSDPDAVAHHADWPVNENDLHARHAWLVGQKDSMQARLEGDPEWCDAKVAGWWVWGMACWIGSGFCSGKGPWQVREIDGVRQLVHVGNEGRGVNRQLVHVGNQGQGVNRKRERLSGFEETGVNAYTGIEHKRPVIAGPAGSNAPLASESDLKAYFQALADRLRKVRVCCGDWPRVCGPSVTKKHGLTAVFLDPPYADTAGRAEDLYRVDCNQVAHAVREWAIEEGKDPLMRIALCGYDSEHQMPEDWECVAWNAGAGFGGQLKTGASQNGKRERVWFSPHCEKNQQPNLL